MTQPQKSLLNMIMCFFLLCVAVAVVVVVAIANQCRQKEKFVRVSELLNFSSANCVARVQQKKVILGAPARKTNVGTKTKSLNHQN